MQFLAHYIYFLYRTLGEKKNPGELGIRGTKSSPDPTEIHKLPRSIRRQTRRQLVNHSATAATAPAIKRSTLLARKSRLRWRMRPPIGGDWPHHRAQAQPKARKSAGTLLPPHWGRDRDTSAW
ncbi:hypothetical protein M5K25_017283 [Dendrobium thyrsiflorum]|uniref:Uncharacterized protein n=1 Tax=Dendrobium thyrsiflorum TaxID=117978 RepID=A0ABD0UMB1_DENTH